MATPETKGIWDALSTAAPSIVQSGVQLTGMLSPKIRDNQLAIAQAEAQTATANAMAAQNQKSEIPWVWILVGVAALVLLIFIMKG